MKVASHFGIPIHKEFIIKTNRFYGCLFGELKLEYQASIKGYGVIKSDSLLNLRKKIEVLLAF